MEETHSKVLFYSPCQNDTFLGSQMDNAPMAIGIYMKNLSVCMDASWRQKNSLNQECWPEVMRAGGTEYSIELITAGWTSVLKRQFLSSDELWQYEEQESKLQDFTVHWNDWSFSISWPCCPTYPSMISFIHFWPTHQMKSSLVTCFFIQGQKYSI